MVDKWVSADADVEVEFSKYSIIETAVLSSDWNRKPVGTALWSISDVTQYPFCKANIIGCSDKAYFIYYSGDPPPAEWKNADRVQGDFYLHFCSSTDCDDSHIEHEIQDEEYIHVAAWRVVSNSTAKELLKKWGQQPPHSSWFEKAVVPTSLAALWQCC